MADFVYIKCPNCQVKIKVDKEKKYHDCPDCKFEFRIEDIQTQLDDLAKPGAGSSSLLDRLKAQSK